MAHGRRALPEGHRRLARFRTQLAIIIHHAKFEQSLGIARCFQGAGFVVDAKDLRVSHRRKRDERRCDQGQTGEHVRHTREMS